MKEKLRKAKTPQEIAAWSKTARMLSNLSRQQGNGPNILKEGLNLRKLMFVEHYMSNGGNATDAAVSAGYTVRKDGFSGMASQNMKDKYVRAAINRRVEEAADKLKISRDRILQEYARIAFAQVTDYYEVVAGDVVVKDKKDLTEDQRAAIADISIFENITTGTRKIAKVKLHYKTEALKNLAKIWGMFEKDNYQRSQVNVNIDDMMAGLPPNIANAVRRKLAETPTYSADSEEQNDSRTIN
jgi:phage terminase small subunit